MTRGVRKSRRAAAAHLGMIAAGLAVAAAIGCAAGAVPSVFPLKLIDTLGREVVLPSRPERIIALRDGAYGQLAALGVRPVGAYVYADTKSDAVNFFDDPRSIAEIAGTAGIDGEIVASLRPDLVLGSGGDHPLLETLSPVFDTGALRTIADYRDNMRLLGAILEREPAASAAIARFDRRLAAYKSLTGPPKRIMLAGGRDTRQFLEEVGPNSALLNELYRCRTSASPSTVNWRQTSIEAMLEADPDIIVLANWSGRPAARYREDLARAPLWNELKAVKSGRVIILDDFRFPDGLSLVKAAKFLDLLMPRLEPGRVPAPLSEAQIASILGD